MARTAPNGIVFRQAEGADERAEATRRCVAVSALPGCLPPDEGGRPGAVDRTLRSLEDAGRLSWTLAFDGDVMVGGTACGVHTAAPAYHATYVALWFGDGYDISNVNRLNFLFQSLHDISQPGCCGNRWHIIAPTNGIDLANMKTHTISVSEQADIFPGLTEYVGVPAGTDWPLV